MREKNILQRLCHIHIVKLLNTFVIDQNIYFVFEYCQNGNLDSLIRKYKQLGEKLSQIYFSQLINTIEYLQINGIMHRDLKPLNIMLDENYNIKLIDFGDAKDINEVE